MNILIVSINRYWRPTPVMPSGVCHVADATRRAGHEVRVLDFMFLREPLAALKVELMKRSPHVVGLSVRNVDNNDMLNTRYFAAELAPVMRSVREMTDAPVVLGGAAVGVMPEELLRLTGADFAVPADGEAVFPELIRNVACGEGADTPGVARMKDGTYSYTEKEPCASSRDCLAPDYPAWVDTARYLANMSTVPLQSKLGCHFRCVYCTYRKIEGNTYRCFSPESVVEAVEGLAARGLRDIEFVDNVFNSPYAHAMAISEGLARLRHGARLQSIEMNPACMDDELLGAMEHAGFVAVGITVESAADPVLAGLGKGFTAGDVRRVARMVRRHRIPCLWIFMLGGPGETWETVRETLRFAREEIRSTDVAFFNTGIRVYPGTELEEIARREGVLSLDSARMLEPVFYCSPGVDAGWMAREVREAVRSNMNFVDGDSLALSWLSSINRVGHALGLRPPLWRRARLIRRGLRLAGVEA
jgi:radical SAM superfamily enzyme YgiQ (UPF0313 family)